MQELKNKLRDLSDKLKNRNTKLSDYFEKIILMLDQKPSEAIDTILKLYVVTQYAELNNNEESLLEEIWKMAQDIKGA
jgi:hypothetical protein